MALFVSGLSHRNAPVELREQLAVDEDKLRELLVDIASTSVVREAIIVSTCNRVEVYAVADVPGEARSLMFRKLCRHRGVEPAAVEAALYTFAEADAIRHAFRVASSLDSMVIGEPQILGQVKDAFALAQSCEAVGPSLHSLFTQAFAGREEGAHRDRDRAARGLRLVRRGRAREEDLRGARGQGGPLVGAGKMSELAARHLVEQGVFPVYVTNRTWARAQEMARALSGTAVPFDELSTALAAVDIVVTSTGAPEPVIRRDTVQRVMHGRRGRRCSSSTSRCPATSRPPSAPSTTCTATTSTISSRSSTRICASAAARRIGPSARRARGREFLARLADVEVIPTIVSLRERLEAIRTGEVKRTLARLPEATQETREAIEAMSTAIVNKILHAPITKLRESSRAGSPRSWLELVHELFGLGRR
jgi:glutamyl-tRNA reductase